MSVYHVTRREHVDGILTDGLDAARVTEGWQAERRDMRRLLDRRGRDEHGPTWVDREGAVFFWVRRRDAEDYARHIDADAIVEVDLSGFDCWMVNNQLVEGLFDSVRYEIGRGGDLGESEEVQAVVDEFFDNAREWNGEHDSGYEVWTQPPVPADAVVEVTDRDGEPLSAEY